jgi:hypothetical protein
VTVFCPDGYVPIPNAILAAAKFWFPLQIDLPLQPQVRDAIYNALNEAGHRLRNLMHQGKLKVYYFKNCGRQSVARSFWATIDADKAMESGIYGPYGKSLQVAPLFLLESELDALLSEQPARKLPLPPSKIPDVVAALLKHGDLTRKEQRAALPKLFEFERYHITDRQFCKAEQQVSRQRGCKRLRAAQ